MNLSSLRADFDEAVANVEYLKNVVLRYLEAEGRAAEVDVKRYVYVIIKFIYLICGGPHGRGRRQTVWSVYVYLHIY